MKFVNDLINKIKNNGIKSKGFGKIPQKVMSDTTLSLSTKSLYAYLCSFADKNGLAFPRRSTILHHLNISKDCYYKHLNILINKGLIKVRKMKGYLNRNSYILIQKPHCYNNKNIFLKGYGAIPKMIMMDTGLSIQAKAIYAYYASYSGNKHNTSKPLKTVLYHLNTSEVTYYTHFNKLVISNYISASQKKTNGRFDSNVFCLNQFTDNVNKENTHNDNIQLPQIKNICKADKTDGIIEVKSDFTEKAFRKEKDKIILDDNINDNECEVLVKENISYKELIQNEFIDKNYLKIIISIMKEVMCSTKSKYRINKIDVLAKDLKERLKSITKEHIIYVCDSLEKVKKEIINIKAYILTSLYNCIDTINLYKPQKQRIYSMDDLDSLAVNFKNIKKEKNNTNNQEMKQSYDIDDLDSLAINLK